MALCIMLEGLCVRRSRCLMLTWTPKLPSNIPYIPTIKGHKGSIKGPLGGPGSAKPWRLLFLATWTSTCNYRNLLSL